MVLSVVCIVCTYLCLLSFKMEPLIKESTVRLVKKLSESADKGEAVETLK